MTSGLAALQETPFYQLEYFFDISPDLLCIAGFNGYFKRINPAVSKTLGYSEEELLSQPINNFIHPDDRHLTSSARNALTQNKPLLHFENRYITKSGESVWLSWTSMPVESEELIFAIAKNITHKKKLDEDRNALLHNLTVLNKNLQQLSYSTSHDLKGPVNNLLCVFSMIDLSKIQDEETITFINMLKSASENLGQTLNNYVEKLTSKDALQANIEKLSLDICLQSVLFSINALVQNSNTIILTDFAKCENVLFNKAYLESILLNLITNAIKYARHGISPVIKISSDIKNGKNILQVSDNGLGFDIDFVKNKMFGKRQKLHHHADSNGIGLYLVQSHVTSLGGKIEVESKLNEGSTFTILFAD